MTMKEMNISINRVSYACPMVVFQMKPGPLMGQVLKEVREAQLSGQLKSREQALEFASRWLKNNSPNV